MRSSSASDQGAVAVDVEQLVRGALRDGEERLGPDPDGDREERQHEQAHLSAAGGHARGGPSYQYETGPDGKRYAVGGEVSIGEATFMLAEHMPDFGSHEPLSLGGTPVRMALHVDDADAFVARAADAGATVLIEVGDQVYGHRAGRIQDPYGHVWVVSHMLEALTGAQMQARIDAQFSG